MLTLATGQMNFEAMPTAEVVKQEKRELEKQLASIEPMRRRQVFVGRFLQYQSIRYSTDCLEACDDTPLDLLAGLVSRLGFSTGLIEMSREAGRLRFVAI
jgi:hypothetical protein